MRQVIATERATMAISQDEREFFVALGDRIGQRRVPVSAPPVLAKAPGVRLEELIGESTAAAKKRGPAPKLQPMPPGSRSSSPAPAQYSWPNCSMRSRARSSPRASPKPA